MSTRAPLDAPVLSRRHHKRQPTPTATGPALAFCAGAWTDFIRHPR
ncbi:hypothetical protein [Streptomyces tsukubensis]|nr:hypothetical protein [Streptomyces tsukubensis]